MIFTFRRLATSQQTKLKKRNIERINNEFVIDEALIKEKYGKTQ